MDSAPHASSTGLRLGADSAELATLIEGVAHGREQALADLYDRACRPVLHLALRLCKDQQLAEEVVMDVFLQVWRSAGTFDANRGRPLGWLLTIARSRALDALRSRHVRTRREGGLPPELESPEHVTAPLDRAAVHDRERQVAGAIAELPPEQARAVELAYFEGLSHSEIAERTGSSLGTVKTRLRLGLSKLREKLTRFEDER